MSAGLLFRLYDACGLSTASYGCEVWGARSLPVGNSRRGRAALASSYLNILRDIVGVPTSVHAAILLKELDQRPLIVCGGSAFSSSVKILLPCLQMIFTGEWPLMIVGMPSCEM